MLTFNILKGNMEAIKGGLYRVNYSLKRSGRNFSDSVISKR